MKLMTVELQKQLPPLYATEHLNADEKLVRVKYFHPLSSMTFYGIEFDVKTREFFGYVKNGDCSEYGYFSLTELERIKLRGIGIERDLYFKPTEISKIISGEVS